MDTSNNSELVSRREYARRKGWVPSHVVTLCQQGRISTWVDCPGCRARVNARDAACICGQPIAGAVDFRTARIDPDIADRELAAHQDPTKAGVRDRWARERGEAQVREPTGKETAPPDSPDGMSYAKAKAQREAFLAGLARLEYEQRSGNLVDIEIVKREVFAKAREARDALQNARARLVPLLAAETDPVRIDEMLAAEFRRLSDEMLRTVHAEHSVQH
jgi:hypothetical protein